MVKLLKFVSAGVAAAAFALAVPAQAATEDWTATPLAGERSFSFVNPTSGAFEHFLMFTIANIGPVTTTAVSLNVIGGSGPNIPGFLGQLYAGTPTTTGTLLTSAATQLTTSNVSETFALTTGQNYYLRFTGAPTASLSAVTGTVVAAVPEPAELAMMLAGLGIVGWVARRKTQTKA